MRRDGSKSPACPWGVYQERLPTDEELRAWFAGGNSYGVGIICGAISGNLELIDFDVDADVLYPAWQELVRAESPDLLERLSVVQTPRDPAGYHVRYRCPGIAIPGNDKLAQREIEDPEQPGKLVRRALIETRGKGGMALAPGSPLECHSTGRPYRHIAGPPLIGIADITPEEREVLIRCARALDESPAEEILPANSRAGARERNTRSDDGLSPGDDYCARGPDWADLLEPHGWRAVHVRGDRTFWRRPGKSTDGWSATTGCRSRSGNDLLCVFSSNAHPFEGPGNGRSCSTHNRFAVYALLNHGGDFSAAARALADRGYGTPARSVTKNGRPAPRSQGAAPSPPAEGEWGAGSEGVVEAVEDPHRLARAHLAGGAWKGCPTLRYWWDEWHSWDGHCYRPETDKEVRAKVTANVKKEYDAAYLVEARNYQELRQRNEKAKPPVVRPVTRNKVGDVLQALTGMALLPGSTTQPAWLEGAGDCRPPADEILACRNGLLHLPAYVAGKKPYLLERTPRFFSAQALDYDFDDLAPPPVNWLAFLKQLWPHNKEQDTIDCLQEMFGYLLLPDSSMQKIFLLVGPPRSGKGTIARVAERVIGTANVCNPTLAGLGTPFGLQPLLGKSLAVIGDARLSSRTDLAVVTERLLSISGQDAITVDRKHASSVTTRLPVRFVILTNELPRLRDAAGALVSRFVLFRLTNSFLGKEDPHLFARLAQELPGILSWAISGWKRLRERGHFVQPVGSGPLVQEMEELSSPVRAFLAECCVLESGASIPCKTLYARWVRWCEDRGQKEVGTEATLGRDLRAAVPWLETRQRRLFGERGRVFLGIRERLSSDPDQEEGTEAE